MIAELENRTQSLKDEIEKNAQIIQGLQAENKNEYERNIFQLKTQIDDITEKKQMENDKKVNFT